MAISPFATTPGTPGGSTSGLSGLLNGLGGQSGGSPSDLFSDKGKGGAQNMSPMVPTAAGGFYQPSSSADRSGLLQAMMQRSRAGRGMPAVAAAPATPTTGTGGY